MFIKIKEEQLMFKHSTDWHIWEDGYQGVPLQDQCPTSSGNEEEESDPMTPDEEEEEIMDPVGRGSNCHGRGHRQRKQQQ
jgi:hypothetical protein